jgi:PAS domain-containing protein
MDAPTVEPQEKVAEKPELSAPPAVTAQPEEKEVAYSEYLSVVMERNFLQRALADLNFHNNAHDGIVFTDVNNRVVYANPYFLTMMNVDNPKDILNKPLPGYMWGGKPEQENDLFRDVRACGFVRERELMLYNRKNEAVFAMCSSVASKDSNGEYVGTEIMLCNITGKRRVEAELRERTRKLERVTQFAQNSLEMLTEMADRGNTGHEMKAILHRLQHELNESVKA